MNLNDLNDVVVVLGALSVASERLVEIVKGWRPFLSHKTVGDDERKRKLYLHGLAIAAGVVTAFLALWFLEEPFGAVFVAKGLGLGILASGGSALWNSVLTYLIKVKDIKNGEAGKALQELTKLRRALNAAQGRAKTVKNKDKPKLQGKKIGVVAMAPTLSRE
jgi:hypothetical protein